MAHLRGGPAPPIGLRADPVPSGHGRDGDHRRLVPLRAELPHPISHRVASACLLVVVLGQPARGEDPADLLSLVRARHRAARESIRTFSADVIKRLTVPEERFITGGTYWRSFNTVRVQEYPPGTGNIEDHLLK